MKPLPDFRRNPLPLMLAIILALVCLNLSAEPVRPEGVPKDAFWLGGPDDGVFVVLKRSDGPGSTSYHGAVYHPYGAIWYQGPFVLNPPGGRPVDMANQGQFAGWDGTQILLEDGRSLVAKRGKPRRSGSR
ncbi:MAG: hypothetical protein PHE55_08980 [Methylococcaceae bacterium]|nr:hypothetical protein [Methylococcaceae bacterium]